MISSLYFCAAIKSLDLGIPSTIDIVSHSVKWKDETHLEKDDILLISFASLKEAFDAANWYDGIFIDACGSIHKLLEDIRHSFTKLWASGGIWGITWNSARHVPKKSVLDANALSKATWDVINDPKVGGPYVASNVRGALVDWTARFCRVAAKRAGFELLMTYEHEENNMRTTIYRVKPIDKQKVIQDFWNGDATRKKMAKELKEVFKF